MDPSFEDSEHKETCVPNLSGQKGGQKRQAILPHLYKSYSINRHASRIVLYIIPNLYKVCALPEVSINSDQLAASCSYRPNQVIMEF
jgi:hypothetical protein